MLQKIKNLGSISKNEISKGISKIAKKRSSLGNLSLSKSKFYENVEIDFDIDHASKYDNKSLNKKARGLSKLQRLGRLTMSKLPTNFSLLEDAVYQNGNETSSPNINESSGNQAVAVNKSLRTKIRKSFTPLIGSSSTSNIYGALSSKSSTFYVNESIDVDSGIFNEKATLSPNNSNLSLNFNINNNIINSESKRRSLSTVISNRPNDPPPPPPDKNETVKTFSSEQSSEAPVSWFTEFDLFKRIEHEDLYRESENKKSNSLVYQTSDNSLARWGFKSSKAFSNLKISYEISSGSSGVSTGGGASAKRNENTRILFFNEPLYQLYTAAKLESISSNDSDPDAESDGYEEITRQDVAELIAETAKSRPSALQLIEPNQGPSRTLWSEVPEVLSSGTFSKLTLYQYYYF